MDGLSVINNKNLRAQNEALISELKADGYHVVVEKQPGINDIKKVYAFRTPAEAKQKLLGEKGEFVVV